MDVIEAAEKMKPEPNVSIVELEEGLPRPRLSRRTKYWTWIRSTISMLRRAFDRKNQEDGSPWPKIVRHLVYVLTAAVILGTITLMYMLQLPPSSYLWLILR